MLSPLICNPKSSMSVIGNDASFPILQKYNSTLETLDMSQNPCCGPSLEGVRVLRLASLGKSLPKLTSKLHNYGIDYGHSNCLHDQHLLEEAISILNGTYL